MPMTIIQSGSALQKIDTIGGLTTLSLPTGVTLRTDVPPRWAVYGRYLVLVNTPSQPLTIDSTGTVRLLTPRPPRLAPVLSGVAGGTLTGAYRSQYTFVIQDAMGNLISESDYSPPSNQVAISAQALQAASLDLSPDDVSGRRLYRTTDGGAVYFQWVDLDGNIITTVQDDLADAGLALIASPILGTPPRLTTIAEFRGRLFGTGDLDIDSLRYTEAGIQYAWPADNLLSIPSVGSDEFGVVALAPRREALGVGRRNTLVQITGTGTENQDGVADFEPIIVSRECGIESQESVRVYRDTAYFLWKDGVYKWNSEGIVCISDGDASGKGQVRSWFASDDFFNRDMFQHAFAHIDQDGPVYRLFLASVGSTTIDRWVEYDINDHTWWGPHKTDEFSPMSAFNRTNAANSDEPMIGGATAAYEQQEDRTDGTATGIAFDVIGKQHDMGVPDQKKYWGEMSILGTKQDAGVLHVTTRAGKLDDAEVDTPAITQQWQLDKSRERLGRPGHGEHLQVELSNDDAGVDVELHGYIVDPVNVLGRR